MANLPTRSGQSLDDDVPFGLGFPVRLVRFAQRFPRAVLAAFLVTGAIFGVLSLRVPEAEDLLDFIPPDDPDVKAFRAVGRTFGVLRVALVGIEAKKGDDVFASDTLAKIGAATEAIKNVRGVDSVESITTLEDFSAGEAGVETAQLVQGPPGSTGWPWQGAWPDTPEARKALRDKVLSRSHVVGNFVSKDGTAALVMVYLAEGAADRIVSRDLRKAVEGVIGDHRAIYGGAPFAASAIYEETQGDIRKLTPLAVLILLGVILFAFRDPVGVVLTILTVAWSAVVVIGVMALKHEPFTAASSALPVILFASGTSYAVHVLGRYYILDIPGLTGGRKPTREEDEARLVTAVKIVGPPVAIASFTTAAGFLACLVMDIRPMRAFGLECAAGVLTAMIAALLMVPAVLALWPRGRHEPAHTGRIGELLAALADWSHRNRKAVLVGSVLLAVGGTIALRDIRVRMEPRAFFRPGSDPYNAERFLAERFGGSQILQVRLGGDFTDPATLHEAKRLEQFARSLPGVTQVQGVVEPIMLINNVMGGERRIPETRQQVQTLLFFLEGRASLKRLLNGTRDESLVMIRTQGETDPVIQEVERYLAGTFNAQPGGPERRTIAERIRWITRAANDPIADEPLNRILDAAKPVALDDSRIVEARREIARSLLTGEGEIMPKRALTDRVTAGGGASRTVAEVIDALATDATPPGPTSVRREDFRALGASPEEGDLGWNAFVERVAVRARGFAVDDALKPAGPLPPDAVPGVRDALSDLFPSQPIAKAEKAMTYALAGEPILERGMSRSVRVNHKKSMIVALGAVMIFIGFLFRSARLALVSVYPAAVTMLVLFGGITLAGLPIDLGTSLVSSIATGAGSEFAMQYLWYVKRSTHADVVRFVGPIMVISTVLIAAGFAVLGLGNSQAMRMFGSLAALSMVGSALFTFLLVPALLRKVDTASDEALPEENVA